MTGYVLVCSESWVNPGLHIPGQFPRECHGTLQSVPASELGSSGLSLEDWAEYRGDVLVLFAMVFGVLAIKKAIF